MRLTTTNEPVPSASVFVWGTGSYLGSGWIDDANATTDDAGRFRLVVRRYSIYDISLGSSTAISRAVEGVQALNDSTFDLYVAPATP